MEATPATGDARRRGGRNRTRGATRPGWTPGPYGADPPWPSPWVMPWPAQQTPMPDGQTAQPATAGLLQSMQSMLTASEGRTMQAFTHLQDDVRDALDGFMPAARVIDRWRQDEQVDARQDRAITELQQGHQELVRAITRLPSRDDISAMLTSALREHPTTLTVQHLIAAEVADKTKNHITAADVKDMLATTRKTGWNEWKNTIGWVVLILGFLMAAGIIHPAALFIGH